MAKRLKWLAEFVIDYGSISLMVALAAIFLYGNCGSSYEESGPFPVGAVGILFSWLAVKLWRDVREDRARTP